MARVRKGDLVAVLSGRNRGKQGKVLKVFPDQGQALVEQVNLLKHFERRTQANQSGGIVTKEAPIALDKLAVVCLRCHHPTRVGIRLVDGVRQRFCKRCGELANA